MYNLLFIQVNVRGFMTLASIILFYIAVFIIPHTNISIIGTILHSHQRQEFWYCQG